MFVWTRTKKPLVANQIWTLKECGWNGVNPGRRAFLRSAAVSPVLVAGVREVAAAAHGEVFFSAADQEELFRLDEPFVEGRVPLALHADGFQLH